MKTKVKTVFSEWSKALQIEQLKADLNKLALDMAKVKKSIVPQAKKTVKKAEKEYQKILGQLTAAQKQWNLEVKKAGDLLKKSTKDVEKTVKGYQKMALKQKAELQKTLKVQAPKVKSAVKKAAPKTVKKAAKPAAKKVSAKSKTKAKTARVKRAPEVVVSPPAGIPSNLSPGI